MESATSRRASIVLPVHNQAEHIGRIVDDYVAELVKLHVPYEIVLVPNGCTDDSVRVCEQLASTHDPVRVVESEWGGWGHAVQTGLATAEGDLLCYTNSARTTAPMLLLTLIYAVAYPDVVVKANRRIRDNWRRRLGSLLYNLECRALFDLASWDVNGTPKVFPREFSKLTSLSRSDDLIDAEFVLVCSREGYPIVEVPILATERHGGRSTTNYGSALRMYRGAFELRRQYGSP